jgi:hypothetical protein
VPRLEIAVPQDKVGFRTLHLPPCAAAPFVARVQSEIRFVLDNYISVKKTLRSNAQTTMIGKLPSIQSAVNKVGKEVEKQIKKDKPLLSFEERKPIYSARIAPIRHQFADPVVQGYELSYKATRTNKTEIQKRILNMALFIDAEGYVGVDSAYNGNADNWKVYTWDGQRWIGIVELWFGDARFIPTEETDVYCHRTKPEKQFVRDRHGFFIARYLIRNLSDFDRTTITKDPALTARNNRIPTDETLVADITTHVRAKEASGGGTCFISFTHTKAIIVGSTGALFYRQEKGDVIIDASQVLPKARVDLHSLEAVEKLFGVTDVNPTMPFVENNEAYENNAAARDTVRTREILIAGSVPAKAIVAVRLSTKEAKAPWTTPDGKPALLPKGIPEAWLN